MEETEERCRGEEEFRQIQQTAAKKELQNKRSWFIIQASVSLAHWFIAWDADFKPDQRQCAHDAKPQSSLRQPNHRGRGDFRETGSARGAGHVNSRQTRNVRAVQSDSKTGTHSSRTSNENTPTRNTHPPSEKPEKRMSLSSRVQKEVHTHLSRNLQQSSSPVDLNESGSGKGKTYNPQQVQGHIKELLGKYSNGFWVSKLPQIYRELYKEDLPTEAIRDLEKWTHICTVEKTCSSNPSELLLYPAKEQTKTSPPPVLLNLKSTAVSGSAPSTEKPLQPPTQQRQPTIQLTHSSSSSSLPPQSRQSFSSSIPSPPSTPAALSPELKQKVNELMMKYTHGMWAEALPKFFQENYKTDLPAHILENLQLLSDICVIVYPLPDNPKRAILYNKPSTELTGRGDENCNRRDSAASEEELGERKDLGNPLVPSLQIPKEEYPSVLVVEATSTSGVIIRYIGEGYSQDQESMEDEMREVYGLDPSSPAPLSSFSSGQLVAVRAEEEEILRAQVCEVMADKLKVYLVDYGFSEMISKTKVFELHERFFKLPFQATKCKLAGLQPFCREPAVLKTFESMANGQILLAEIIEQGQTPLVVLYDTSQEDDININSACLKSLQDTMLSSPIQVDSTCMNVTVSSVCSDGTIYCQLPSKGLTKLSEILENVEAYFHSQVTTESLVSRPFCGKGCLARYKSKWSRVEITNLHGSRVLDIVFIDVGVQASVEVFELREIPPPFLRDLVAIPPQAVKCCLADLHVSVGSWTPDAVQWLREKVLNSTDCSIKVARVDETKNRVHVHLFTDRNYQNLDRSLNHQLARSELFKQHPDVFLISHSSTKSSTPASSSKISSPSDSTDGSPTSTFAPAKTKGRMTQSGSVSRRGENPASGSPPQTLSSLQLPPLLQLPAAGSTMDVYVSVACHPGHFVLQPWTDIYKLATLMGDMVLYYNKTEAQPLNIEKTQIYAAKVENNWYRVLVKGVLTNGLVSVYELDYGKHELVTCTQLRPLVNQFRQLPFQAITAQLAGTKQKQWSEEASIVFRNHVEKKPLVAQLENIQEATHSWDRKMTVFLADTSQEDKDIWMHDIMAEFADELSSEL
ncbi:tudor domain-containing protein 7B isoform X2 [Thalassophryne amazonica]|uniref:tudor domain-containing protein 7B isoform X2 n=1 Tax=Thalassophryne amazonica TaxID=390379 RepID=UPI0014715292|nr:tudor domain-containing protein 7B isoform X2 [Thalassophryne amazonica]